MHEYKTKLCPLTLYRTYAFDPGATEGFVRVWADVTVDGTFVVYRREVKSGKRAVRVWKAGKSVVKSL